MKHIADIGFVNSHTKGIGGDHHRKTVIDEILLCLSALLIGHASMVSGSINPHFCKILPQFIHIFSGSTVDNAAFLRMLPDIGLHIGIFFPCIFHCKIQIFPVKACDQHSRIFQPQNTEDIFLYFLRGCSGKSTEHRTPVQFL